MTKYNTKGYFDQPFWNLSSQFDRRSDAVINILGSFGRIINSLDMIFDLMMIRSRRWQAVVKNDRYQSTGMWNSQYITRGKNFCSLADLRIGINLDHCITYTYIHSLTFYYATPIFSCFRFELSTCNI